jgi:thioesterase domain-containing protein
MQPAELEQYLREHIPLAAAMQVSVLEIGLAAVRLGAPLAPNINHRDTVFGGSAAAVAILSAWSLLHVRMHALDVPGRLVIRRNTMHYHAPIRGAFTARSALAPDADWQGFARTLARRGMARIEALAELDCAGVRVGSLAGEFVALEPARD